MKTDDPNMPMNLARAVAGQAIRRWPTLPRRYRDEVFSEALVAAAQSLSHYADKVPGHRGYSPSMQWYAYGCLVNALRREGYLPRRTSGYGTVDTHGSEWPGDWQPEQLNGFDRVDVEDFIEVACGRHAELARLRWLDGWEQGALAARYGVTRQRISQRLAEVRESLRRAYDRLERG